MGFAIGIGNGLHLRRNIINNFLINKYPGAVGAYSLRKLSINTNNVIRVRRNSDNEEQDFTPAEITNGILVSFVGAGNNGLVAALYDQSGNSNDAVQATAGSQPKIVNAGVLITENGKPAIDFDGIDDKLINTSLTTSQPQTIIIVSKSNAVSPFPPILMYDDDDGSSRSSLSIETDGGNAAFAGAVIETAPGIATTINSLYTTLYNGANSDIYKNGTNVASGNVGSQGLSGLTIGGRFSSFSLWNGKIQELIVYASNQSANRSAIEDNINKTYNIY